MRLKLSVIIIFALVTFGTPFAVFLAQKDTSSPAPPQTSSATSGAADKGQQKSHTIKVLDGSTGQVQELALRDYLYGAVAAEMPPNFSQEALKAQAIACSTYAVRLKQQAATSPNADLKGADISVDSKVHQGYVSTDEMKKMWGDNFDTYFALIKDAVDPVADQVLTYEGAPIISAYHSISPGKTEAAADIWGQEVPYLVSVDSPGDALAPDYETKEVFTAAVVKENLLTAFSDIAFTEDPAGWFTDPAATAAGSVKTIKVCGKELTGDDIRTALNLRCAAFTVAFADGNFTFTVKGYGHGVGMSQYGADYMGRQGSSYQDILAHYFPNTSVEPIDNFL
ncbi:H-34 [Anaerotruncus sp. 2789STDY5834896]|uniref:H-34 n=1 Tax=uncultured Anaerotruncus sp. TaxID=905011 RepID=A0A1C6IHK6_9FIRM|nr:H-34 [uncultured Anaerotruncus sp.]